MALSIQALTNNLSFSMSLSHTLIFPKPTTSAAKPLPPPSLTIRMGGGPRTFPGGVSKWQWKRMQANKAKQLLKARLSRERQIYEMRKRAELRAAVSELERPWEAVEKAPTLLSFAADDQVKVLADRFQRPGGFDMWTDRDGPQLFRTADDLPSARFFPKGVVHSVKPYRRDPQLEGESREPLETSGSDRNGNNVVELRDQRERDRSLNSRNPNYGLRDNGYKRNVNSLALSDTEIGNVERNYLENEDSEGFVEQRALNSKNSDGFRKSGYERKFESSSSNDLGFSDSENENLEEFGERRALNLKNSNGSRNNGYQRKFGSSGSNDFAFSDSKNKSLEEFGEQRRLISKNSNGHRNNGYQRKFGSSDSNELTFSHSENENFQEFREQRAVHSNYSNGFRKNGYQRKFGTSDSKNGNLEDFKDKRAFNSKNSNGFRNSNYRRKFESSGSDSEVGNNGGEFGYRGYRNDRRSYDSRSRGRLGSTAEDSSGSHGSFREQRNQNNKGSYGREMRSRSGSFSERKVENNEQLGSKSGGFRMNENGLIRKNDSRSRFNVDRNQSGTKSPNFRRSESRYSRGNGPRKVMNNSRSEVFDMNLREDGSYEVQ